jgi:hypothetical protein
MKDEKASQRVSRGQVKKRQEQKRPTSPLQSLTEECLPDQVPNLAWIQRVIRPFRVVYFVLGAVQRVCSLRA